MKAMHIVSEAHVTYLSKVLIRKMYAKGARSNVVG
jgi:hypothetical protein